MSLHTVIEAHPDVGGVGSLTINQSASTLSQGYTANSVLKNYTLQKVGTNPRDLYVTWAFDENAGWLRLSDGTKKMAGYRTVWEYCVASNIWIVGQDKTEEVKYSAYTAPEKAIAIRVRSILVSKTHEYTTYATGEKEQRIYFIGKWTDYRYRNFEFYPDKGTSPTLELVDNSLTISSSNIDVTEANAKRIPKYINYQLARNDIAYNSFEVQVNNLGYASAKIILPDGGDRYSVRAREKWNNVYGEWSDFGEYVSTRPATIVASSYTASAISENSVHLEWGAAKGANSYTVEYTYQSSYFDTNTSEVSSADTQLPRIDILNIDVADNHNTWYFRVKSINDNGESDWSVIRAVTLGQAPASPTTWSSVQSAIVGDVVTLYWAHNSKDGSKEVSANLELTVNGKVSTITVNRSSTLEDGEPSSYTLQTSGYSAGAKIQWRVRTKGAHPNYGTWSVERLISVYSRPTLSLEIINSQSQVIGTSLTALPVYLVGTAGPNSQNATGLSVSIRANQTYQGTDVVGNIVTILEGDLVYSKYYAMNTNTYRIELSADNLSLMSGISYTITATVSMNSGLTATASNTVTVSWVGNDYLIDADLIYDKSNCAMYVRPFCVSNTTGDYVSGVTMDVYRREYDGTFAKITSNIPNTLTTFAVDPHPSLNYARYRIVVRTLSTGEIDYNDLPAYTIKEMSCILQWDETWQMFDVTDDPYEQSASVPLNGSMVKLPYNLDVSDDYDADVELVTYAGRRSPVSYYGTQLGQSATWNMEIEKSDINTLYALRRLAVWMGDVYVREPSGSGYWARVKVSFSQKHKDLTIPVTLNITRVEGGI